MQQFHISENHLHLATSNTSGFLYAFNGADETFELVSTLPDFNGTALRVSDDGNVVIGLEPNNDVEIAYRQPGETDFGFVYSSDYNLRFGNCEANFKLYPIIYLAGSNDAHSNLIMKFDAVSGTLTTVANFSVKTSNGVALFSDKIEFSDNLEYVALIANKYIPLYALGKLENDQFTLLTSGWVSYPGVSDISFEIVESQAK